MGTEAPKPPVAVRIVRPFKTEDEFVKAELETITRTGVVLLGAQQRPQGVVLRFEITLQGGEVLVRGEGRVVGYKPAAQNDLPGLTLRFTRLDSKSKQLVDRIAGIREERARVALQASMGESSIPPARASQIPPEQVPAVAMPDIRMVSIAPVLSAPPAFSPSLMPLSTPPAYPAGTPLGPPVRISSPPPPMNSSTEESSLEPSPVPMPVTRSSPPPSVIPAPSTLRSSPPPPPRSTSYGAASHGPAAHAAPPSGKDPALQRLRERAKRLSAGDLARIREQGERLRKLS